MASIKRIGRDSLGVPIWEAVYRRTPGGKQVRRRFHLPARADVERAILLESDAPSSGLKWSEGLGIYLDAKVAERKTDGSLRNVEHAVGVFLGMIGDIAVEATSPETFKTFMSRATAASGPKVANHHRRELLAVARFLRNRAGKIRSVPFDHVAPLPTIIEPREPISPEKISAYLDALPPHVLRPVQMVLLYGLRSSAICNLRTGDVRPDRLLALDKGRVRRRIPIDDTLGRIIAAAMEYRKGFAECPDSLFLNLSGRRWCAQTLLRAAQAAWRKAGLEKKKIHEVRHTLGTLAGKKFTPGVVQALMGHRSRKSAEAYFHPSEEMAAEARREIVTELSRKQSDVSRNERKPMELIIDENGKSVCPCCGVNLYVSKETTVTP
jgi:integrase